MLTPPASDQYWFGSMSAVSTSLRSRVAECPGSGAISSRAVDALLQMWIGEVKVPERQTSVGDVIAFSFLEIQVFRVCDVAPAEDTNFTLHGEDIPTT